MLPLAHNALLASIAASALGAIVMCLLVFKYGFFPPGDEQEGAALRRIVITRLGYGLAGACFAITAMLDVVVLSVAPRPDVRALVAAERFQFDRLARQIDSLTGRLDYVDLTVQQLGTAAERTDARVGELEATTAARRTTRVAPPSMLTPPRIRPSAASRRVHGPTTSTERATPAGSKVAASAAATSSSVAAMATPTPSDSSVQPVRTSSEVSTPAATVASPAPSTAVTEPARFTPKPSPTVERQQFDGNEIAARWRQTLDGVRSASRGVRAKVVILSRKLREVFGGRGE